MSSSYNYIFKIFRNSSPRGRRSLVQLTMVYYCRAAPFHVPWLGIWHSTSKNAKGRWATLISVFLGKLFRRLLSQPINGTSYLLFLSISNLRVEQYHVLLKVICSSLHLESSVWEATAPMVILGKQAWNKNPLGASKKSWSSYCFAGNLHLLPWVFYLNTGDDLKM